MRIRHLVVALLLMSAGPARAACPLIGTLPAAPNDFELQFGATNTNAALGSGRLTATLSACGEITSLKWPGPSYWNQLDYLTDNSVGARLEPHFGALDDAGAFAGIAYRTRAGSGFTWLRDDPWTHAQQYTADDSDVAVTVTTNAALGLTVTAWTFVLPDADVLVNHYRVERAPGSPVRTASVVFYANLAPTMNRLPDFPVADWGLDFENDYAVVYDHRAHALLAFLPRSAARSRTPSTAWSHSSPSPASTSRSGPHRATPASRPASTTPRSAAIRARSRIARSAPSSSRPPSTPSPAPPSSATG